MSSILTSIINIDNYTMVLMTLSIVMMFLYVVLAVFGKKSLKVGIIIACLMTIAANACFTSIDVSSSYIEEDISKYVVEETNSILDTYAIDSASVHINTDLQ